MESSPQRAAALANRPTTTFLSDSLAELPRINNLTADERLMAVTTIINNVRESILARALWAINNHVVLLIPDLEAISSELVAMRVVSALRGLNSNASQDRLLNHLSDDIHDCASQLNNIIRRKERTIHADMLAGMGGNGDRSNLGNPNLGDLSDRNSRGKPAREKLRHRNDVNYTGQDGNININDFLIASRDIFSCADEGASEILTARDKVLHLRTQITGQARETLRLEEKNLRDGAYPFPANILDEFDIPESGWRDVAVNAPVDFTDFLRFIFTSRSESDQRREEYNAIKSRGYFSDPDGIRRALQRAAIAVGTARPDIAISPQQLLQDFLHMIPAEHCTRIYESVEYNSTGGAGINIDVAARVAQNHHRALMRTTTSGAKGASRVTALLPADTLTAMQTTGVHASEVHANPQLFQIEAQLNAIQAQLIAQANGAIGRGVSVPSPPATECWDDDEISAVAMAAANNNTLYSLAQRNYNAQRRQEMRDHRDNKTATQVPQGLKVRCYGCGQLGHIAANCPNPQPRPGFTPFRRVRHRDRNAGNPNGSTARPVRFYRRDPNTHRLTALKDNELANEDAYVYAIEVGDSEDQAFILA